MGFVPAPPPPPPRGEVSASLVGLRAVDVSEFSASLIRTSGAFPAPSLLDQKQHVVSGLLFCGVRV